MSNANTNTNTNANAEAELAALRAELAAIKAALGPVIQGHSVARQVASNLQVRLLIGDTLSEYIVVMQSACIEWERGGRTAQAGQAAMVWLYNTLAGPGHLNFDSAAQTAQKWFDQQIERIEAHRASHPAPASPKEPT